MTNTVLIKRSSVANTVPLAGDLAYGELAINYNDGTLYFKDAANAVVSIASTKSISVTGNVTAGNVVSTGTVTSGNVIYTNIDGTNGQFLATDGNGQTYFQTISSTNNANLHVYLRSGGYAAVLVSNGLLNVVGRTGIIDVPLSP